MDAEQFFIEIERFLEEGRNSQATDLLTEFLFNLYGQPVSLNRVLPNFQGLSRNSPQEIVNMLKVAFSQNNLSDDEDLNNEDFDLIESNSKTFVARVTHYELNEEGNEGINVSTRLSEDRASILCVSSAYTSAPSSKTSGLVSLQDIASPVLVENEMPDQSKSQDFDHQKDPLSINFPLGQLSFQYSWTEDNGDFSDAEQGSFAVKGTMEPILDEDFDNEDIFFTNQNIEPEETFSDVSDLDGFDDFYEHIDDEHDRSELNNVIFEGTISREDRAYQVALKLGLAFNLESEEIDLIHEIFIENGWAQARVAIERELRKGTSVEEIMLAKEMKNLWNDREDFAIGFSRSKRDKSNYTYSAGTILSWVMALNVVKLFPRGISFSELEFFLENTFSAWFQSADKRAANHSFLSHLHFLAQEKESALFLSPDLSIFYNNDFWENDNICEEWGYGSPIHAQLKSLGVINN